MRFAGAFGALFKLPAGFLVPLHTHTHDMRVVFISGTYVQQPEGRPEFRLGPGSYMMQPGGTYRHITSCDKSADCVFFVESDGAFDLSVVELRSPWLTDLSEALTTLAPPGARVGPCASSPAARRTRA